MLVEPGAALACGGFLKAKGGEPGFGVEEGASNGGMGNLLWFVGRKVEGRQLGFVGLDESFLDKGGELAFELGMSHERYLNGWVGWWWYVVLVGHGILELVKCHGSVWFLNVLCKSPKEE